MKWYGRTLRLAALVALVAGVGACQDLAPGPVEPSRPGAPLVGGTLRIAESTLSHSGTTVEAIIGPAGGELKIPGGHSLYFPAGALAQATPIRAVRDRTLVKVEFGPHGLVFPDSALPTLTLSYAKVEGVTDADAIGLSIVYVDAHGNAVEVLKTTPDTVADVVRARLRHFSTYVLVTD